MVAAPFLNLAPLLRRISIEARSVLPPAQNGSGEEPFSSARRAVN
jgi:hypothetical protein